MTRVNATAKQVVAGEMSSKDIVVTPWRFVRMNSLVVAGPVWSLEMIRCHECDLGRYGLWSHWLDRVPNNSSPEIGTTTDHMEFLVDSALV